MNRSEDIKELAGALVKAQAKIETAAKDSVNPHFNKKYADLASVWRACRKPLTDEGLAVVQTASFVEGRICVSTMLLHTSGQFLSEDISVPFTAEAGRSAAQSVGSCITYLRRYTLSAMTSVCPEDDDGNGAGGGDQRRRDRMEGDARTYKPKPAPEAAASRESGDDEDQDPPGREDDDDRETPAQRAIRERREALDKAGGTLPKPVAPAAAAPKVGLNPPRTARPDPAGEQPWVVEDAVSRHATCRRHPKDAKGKKVYLMRYEGNGSTGPYVLYNCPMKDAPPEGNARGYCRTSASEEVIFGAAD